MTDTTDNTSEPQAEPTQAEHDAAMATKAQGEMNVNGRGGNAGEEPVVIAERPTNIPEKFWDKDTGTMRTEDLMKSYAEMERKQSVQKEDPKSGEAEGKEGEPEPKGDVPSTTTAIETAREVYAQTGELSEDAINGLKDAGFDDSTIGNYMDGIKAQEEILTSKAYAAAGGQEAFESMSKWAAENFNEAEITAFNGQIANPDTMSFTIQGLKAQYVASVGSDGTFVEGNGSQGTADVYNSKQQLVSAMSDPRYATDKAYREEVGAKLHRSKKAGSF